MRRIGLMAVVVVLAGVGQVEASITIIDDFTSVGDPTPWPATLPPFGPNVYFTETGLSDVLKGQRTFSIKTRGDLPAVGQSEGNVTPDPGILTFSTNAENFSSVAIAWQTTAADPFDLSSALAINFDFVSTDPLQTTLLLSDGSGSAVSRSTIGGDLSFPLSEFSSALDLRGILIIEIVAGGQSLRDNGGGFVLDRVFISSNVIPEPTTSALALAALCLVMGRRRSR